jgi:hypothetical protein
LNNISNVARYSQSYGNASYAVDDTLWALFAQDNWKIRHDFTLIWVRYEQRIYRRPQEFCTESALRMTGGAAAPL